jgi:hypothetical protein
MLNGYQSCNIGSLSWCGSSGTHIKCVKNFRDLKNYYSNNYTDNDAEIGWNIIISKFILFHKFFTIQGDAFLEMKK